jgi:glycosyltransferase involved in cell wall biosynthesis
VNIVITSPIFPPDLGGPATYVPSAASWLAARGHSVTVVAFCSDPAPAGWSFRVVSVARNWMPLRYLRDTLEVWRAAKGADVVYVNEHLALHVVFAARLRGVPVVIRTYVDGTWEITHRMGWHEDTIVDYQSRHYGWRVELLRGLQRTWWRWARRIIVPSEFIFGLVEAHGVPPQKLELIHNAYHGPAEFAESRAESRAGLGVPPERVVLLSICRLMVWKGVDGLIRALARLPESHHLHVCGDGDELEAWTRLAAELGVGSRVHFEGNVPHAQVMRWIRAADCFLLNSTYEGLSHTLLEVMWLGCPAAVSTAGGNVELITDRVNGRSFAPGDVDAIEASIREITGSPEVAGRYAELSRRKVREGFSRQAIFERTEQLLFSAAGREPHVPAPAASSGDERHVAAV